MIKKRKKIVKKITTKKLRFVVDNDMAIAMTGWFRLKKYAKLFSAIEVTGSPESPDTFVYQKAGEINAHILTCNYKDYKNQVKSKKSPGVVSCKQPSTEKISTQDEQNVINITKEYSNDDLYGKIIIVDGEGIKKKKEF